MSSEKSHAEGSTYGEQLYRLMFEIVGNKKNAALIESLRGENAVLTYLMRHVEEVHPGDIADALSLVPGRMTDILKTLEKKGMIRREKDPEDGRRVLVRITPKGSRSVMERREQIREQYSGLYETLGLEDTVRLIELLKKVTVYFNSM